MKNVLWILTLGLVVLMAAQWGVHLGGEVKQVPAASGERLPDGSPKTVEKRCGGAHVTPGDVLLALTVLLWAVHVAARFKLCEVRFPFLAAFVFVAVVFVSALRAGEIKTGVREAAQLGAYFIGAWLVFANCIGTRRRLRAAVELFSVVVALVVVIALGQYRAAVDGNAFEVAGTFGNRNVLGAFLAVALPFVFALALYEKRIWQRFALVLTVALGAMVTLSGGALIAITLALLFVAALRSQRAVLGVLIAAGLAVVVVPATLVLPHHADIVVNSVNPYLRENYLDRSGRGREPRRDYLVTATRYKRWHAAINLMQAPGTPLLFGVGPGRFSQSVALHYGEAEKPSGRTDVVAGFNISADEPDTFNMYLVTCVEAGPLALLALLWLGVLLLGRNLRNHAGCRDDFGKALALGAAGAVVGGALCGVFSNLLVRGIAMPFIFVVLSGILWAKLSDASEPERAR